MNPSRSDANRGLFEAYLRIRDLLQSEGVSLEDDEPWHGSGLGTEEPPALASATDLLIAWKPESTVESTAAPPGLLSRGRPARTPWEGLVEPMRRTSDAMPGPEPPLVAGPLSATLDDLWDEEAANAAVDCLFAFVHAMERRDVDAAMEYIAADYHVMDGYVEIDRAALRLRLEQMVDQRRSGTLQVSLAEVPEPVFHPAGILMRVNVQVDHAPPGGTPECLLLSCVAVLNETGTGAWLISAMSPMP